MARRSCRSSRRPRRWCCTSSSRAARDARRRRSERVAAEREAPAFAAGAGARQGRRALRGRSTTLEARHVGDAPPRRSRRCAPTGWTAATAAFADFERKDIQHRENLKNMKQRAKKLDEKLVKDNKKRDDMAEAEARAIEARLLPACSARRRRAASGSRCRRRGNCARVDALAAPGRDGRRRRGVSAGQEGRSAVACRTSLQQPPHCRASRAAAERDVLVPTNETRSACAWRPAGRGEGELAAPRRLEDGHGDAEATLAADFLARALLSARES